MSPNSEHLKQETLKARARLWRYGKTAEDMRELLERKRAYCEGVAPGFDAVVADWSVLQISAALEYAALSAWHVALLHKANADRLTGIMLSYAYWRQKRVLAVVQEKMLQDYKRGKKSREGGENARGRKEDRHARAKAFYDLDQELTRTDLTTARHKLVAKKAAARGIAKASYKTVERDLKKYVRFV
jgi:hypothetical protein